LEDNRSVSPCPAITVDACEGHNLQEGQREDEDDEEEVERPHMLSLPKRRHSDVTRSSSVTYYKSSLLGGGGGRGGGGSRSENVLFSLHNHKSLDITSASMESGCLDLPGSYTDKTEARRVITALCSPETHRRIYDTHKSRNSSSAQDTGSTSKNS
jgi:hypothetical protein